MEKKEFISVRTAFYKNNEMTLQRTKTKYKKDEKGNKVKEQYSENIHYKGTEELIDHILRTGNTNSNNIKKELTKFNKNFISENFESNDLFDVYLTAKNDYLKATNKNVRSDMNTTFENVIVFSEDQIINIENRIKQLNPSFNDEQVHDLLTKKLSKYLQKFGENEEKNGHGMRFLGGTLHFDEGHYDKNGQWKRNIHAHLLFFNYDFKNKISPLKHLSISSRIYQPGVPENEQISFYQTPELNPNFVAIQDRAAEIFKPFGFRRGISKLITGKEHLSKEKFVQEKLKEEAKKIKKANKILENKNKLIESLDQKISEIRDSFGSWLRTFKAAMWKPSERHAEALSSKIDDMYQVDKPIAFIADQSIDQAEEDFTTPETPEAAKPSFHRNKIKPK